MAKKDRDIEAVTKNAEKSMQVTGGHKRCKHCGRVFSLMKNDLSKYADRPYECDYCKSLPKSKRGQPEKVGDIKEDPEKKDFDDNMIQGEK